MIGTRRISLLIAVLLATTMASGTAAVVVDLGDDSGHRPITGLGQGPARHITSQVPPVPRRGSYLGAFVQPREWTQEGRVKAIRAFEDALGRRLDIVHTYRRWDEAFPRESDYAAVRDGSFLMFSKAWPDAELIASGAEDRAIAQLARAIKRFRAPIFFEPRWEMDRPNLSQVIHSPRTFVRAWQRMHAIFTRLGVRNAAWVWCPTAAGFTDGRAPAYFPGDESVDWICADAYPTQFEESLKSLIGPFLSWAAQHPKPIMLGEFGVPRSQGSLRRADWIQAAETTVRRDRQVKAVVYFDADGTGEIPLYAYALSGDDWALHAFRRWAQRPYFDVNGLAR